VSLWTPGAKKESAQKKRTGAIAHCAFVVAHGPHSIGYEYGGGLDWLQYDMAQAQKRFLDGLIWDADCRAVINWVTEWSGWKGFGKYGHRASSGEMWVTLPHFTDVRDCNAGTIVTYGAGGSVHVTMVMQPDGDNPWLMSHGSKFSDNHVRYEDETAYHEARGHLPTLLAVGGLID
jgi:hypothetical protein